MLPLSKGPPTFCAVPPTAPSALNCDPTEPLSASMLDFSAMRAELREKARLEVGVKRVLVMGERRASLFMLLAV